MKKKEIHLSFINYEIVIINNGILTDAQMIKLESYLPTIFLKKTKNNSILVSSIYLHKTEHIREYKWTKKMIHGGEEEYRQFIDYYEDDNNIYYKYPTMLGIADKKNKKIDFFIQEPDLLSLRFFIKSFILEFLYSKNWFPCHGAAIVYNNKAYLIAGQKGDGKTTLLLALGLSNDDISILANDMLLINNNVNDAAVVCSGDTNIRITKESINLIKKSFGSKIDEYFSNETTILKNGKFLVNLRNFQKVELDDMYKINGIIICNKKKNELCQIKIPEYIYKDNTLEHPIWINLFNTNNLKENVNTFLKKQIQTINLIKTPELNTIVNYTVKGLKKYDEDN